MRLASPLTTALLSIALIPVRASAQWEIQTSHTTAGLRGIHALSDQIAWASGTDGTVLRTVNGGKGWLPCAVPPGASEAHLDFRGIQAFDASTAIVMSSGLGDLSRLYKTTDACRTWTLLFTNPDKDGFWDAVVFQDKSFGMLLGDPVGSTFYLAVTTDGGVHWIRKHNKGLSADSKMQGAFAASNSSLLVRNGGAEFGSGGTGGANLYSEREIVICLDNCPESDLNLDGRKNNWMRAPVPLGSGTEASGLFSVAARSEARGDKLLVAVGGDYQKPNDATGAAAFTSDGSVTWLPATTPPHGYRSSVAYSAATKTWITVGPNGTDISTDDGRNWRALKPSPTDAPDADRDWNALSLPFVVGPHGRIGKLRPNALAAPPLAKP